MSSKKAEWSVLGGPELLIGTLTLNITVGSYCNKPENQLIDVLGGGLR